MPERLSPAESEVVDAAEGVIFADDEERDLFRAAQAAVEALVGKKGCAPLAALWWLYSAPMEMTKASYSSYYGVKEVWTVTVEVPARVKAAMDQAAAKRGLQMRLEE